jgi:amidase
MRLPEYDRLDALALGGLVASGQVTAAELLEAALERADARNPALNAIVHRADDVARRRAAGALPAGPLSGVPFLIKDLLTAWKGQPMTFSSRLGAGFRPGFDSEVVRRLEAAGLNLFGTTNAPELGILAHTEPRLHGPCRNPWNTDHTPGGSSGGSASAVAARIVPAAHGNDGGGSLRIPASHGGLFGLKPTRGRVSFAPASDGWDGMACEGVLTRSVRDSAALLDVLAGPLPGDTFTPPPPARPWLEEVGRPPGRLRIAFTEESFFGRTTHDECRAAVRDAATALAALGHELVEDRPPFDREPMVHAYLVVVAAGVGAAVENLSRLTGRRARQSLLEPETVGLVAGGRAFSATEHVAALDTTRAWARQIGPFFERYDLLLTPTVGQPPVRVGALQPRPLEALGIRLAALLGSRRLLDTMFAEIGDRSFEATGFTMPWNQTGQPAASVPIRWTPEGLPLGAQLVGRFGDEATLVRVAAQLEAARPWAARTPPGIG